jgi:YebC/PmpR family DNA-binding regulatory protein
MIARRDVSDEEAATLPGAALRPSEAAGEPPSASGPATPPGGILRPMSGHSKWAQIKRQKGANDVKRGAMFTKMGREIAVAARAGGGDPDGNFRLRLAIERARAVNMPADTIKRAIEKAVGGGEGEQFEEITYEGYGPGGVAILVEAATDNRNRTAADVRSIFSRAGGQMAGAGSVAWQFEQRGVITLAPEGDPEQLELAAIDAGADDVDAAGETVEVYTKPADLEVVRRNLQHAGVKIEAADLSMIAKNTIELDEAKARQALRLVELLEDQDDVQRVTANFEIPEAVMAEAGG